MADRATTNAPPSKLVEGQRLDQPTFHALYVAMPPGTRAEFQERLIDDDGLYRSSAFPGLWLDPVALLEGDTRRLRAVVEQGCATPDHAAFVARLAGSRESS